MQLHGGNRSQPDNLLCWSPCSAELNKGNQNVLVALRNYELVWWGETTRTIWKWWWTPRLWGCAHHLFCLSSLSETTKAVAGALGYKSLWLLESQTDQVWPFAADKIQREREEWWWNEKGIYLSEVSSEKTLLTCWKSFRVYIRKM